MATVGNCVYSHVQETTDGVVGSNKKGWARQFLSAVRTFVTNNQTTFWSVVILVFAAVMTVGQLHQREKMEAFDVKAAKEVKSTNTITIPDIHFNAK
jgi:hypothetical protein